MVSVFFQGKSLLIYSFFLVLAVLGSIQHAWKLIVPIYLRYQRKHNIGKYNRISSASIAFFPERGPRPKARPSWLQSFIHGILTENLMVRGFEYRSFVNHLHPRRRQDEVTQNKSVYHNVTNETNFQSFNSSGPTLIGHSLIMLFSLEI